MRMRLATSLVTAFGAVAACGVTEASAATEIGSNCTATATTQPELATVQVSEASSPQPMTAPVSGVITQWRINLGVITASSFRQQLLVLRPGIGPKEFHVVAASPAMIHFGANVIDDRIPIAAGDRLGLDGEPGKAGALICETNHSGDRVGAILANTSAGATLPVLEEFEERLVAASAVIEPDADGDGYGDETQDRCPQNPAAQGACPVAAPPAAVPPVGLSTFPIVGRSAVTVLVAADVAAPVEVAGTVKLGKGKPLKLRGGSKNLAAGAITAFTLKFPRRLTERLAELAPSRSLGLKIAATARSASGEPSSRRFGVKLKGRA